MTLRITIHEDRAPMIVKDAGDLERVLLAASDEAQARKVLCGVVIQAENENEMYMVVGGEETALGFDFAEPNASYYASKGPSDDIDPVLTWYLNFHHHTESPRKNVIPFLQGMLAVKEFLASPGLPTCIEWEEV